MLPAEANQPRRLDRRRLHRWCVLLALAVSGLWLLVGPGPKYEEGWGLLAAAVALGGLALLASALRPTRWLNGLVFPGLFALPFGVNALRMQRAYGDTLDGQAFALVGLASGASVGLLLLLNSAALSLGGRRA